MNAAELTPITRDAMAFLMQEPTAFQIDEKLREVMMGAFRVHPMVIGIWLRLTYERREECPTWQPLLNAGIESCRDHNVNFEHCFYGLFPNRTQPQRNTGHPVAGPHPWNAAIRRQSSV